MSDTLDYRAAVAAAIRAPSLHNSQPWRFRLRDEAIEVRLDPRRRLAASDPSGWAARMAGGAAVFNLRLALANQGRAPHVRLLPDPTEPDLLARVWPGYTRPPTPAEQRLWQAIGHRHSNRAPFRPDPVPADARTALAAAARAEHGWLQLLVGAGPIAALAGLTGTANQVLMRSDAYRAELAAWTRNDPAVDGVPAAAGGPSPEPEALLSARLAVHLSRQAGADFELHPLVAVLGSFADTPGDQLVAGQALQRVLLTATDAGLAASMLSQPIEVAAAREQLRLALRQSGAPQMVLRIGYGPPGVPTPRRPVADVLDPPGEQLDLRPPPLGPPALAPTSVAGRRCR